MTPVGLTFLGLSVLLTVGMVLARYRAVIREQHEVILDLEEQRAVQEVQIIALEGELRGRSVFRPVVRIEASRAELN